MSSIKLAIVDFGMGNLHSVARALQAAAPEAQIKLAQDPQTIAQADRVVLPGQGAMRDCMGNLQKSGLYDSVMSAARNKPLLGVCVGQQMLFERSEEGNVSSLGVFPGYVKRFKGGLFASLEHEGPLKVPHMGWSRVNHVKPHVLWDGIPDHSYFYFVHSYYVEPADDQLIVGNTLYGHDFTCAIAKDNIFAVQFHPEKSADYGLRLYRNFVFWNV